jgi:cell division septal protein FtsQ
MDSHAKHIVAVLILVVIVAVLGVLPMLTGQEEYRSIQVKGVFVLVDEKKLLDRIMSVSARYHERQQFIDEVYSMLREEPYIASSSIRYSWPDEVEIAIAEINPLAIVNQSALLIGDCRVVPNSRTGMPIKLPNIEIDEKSIDESKCRQLQSMLPVIRKLSLNKITALVNSDYILEIDGRQLVTGYENIVNDQNKLLKVIAMMKSGVVNAEYVDMRYVSGLAIRKVATL